MTGEFKLNLERSTAVVISASGNNVRVYSDLADMQLLRVFKSALEYVQGIKIEQEQEEPQVSVITIIFDVENQIFMTANIGWKRVRVFLATLVRDLAGSTAVKVPPSEGIALRNLARVYSSKNS